MTISESARVALDQTACVRQQSNIGSTTFYNLCEGTQATVPWGSADWAGALSACVVMGAFVALFITLVGAIVWMVRNP